MTAPGDGKRDRPGLASSAAWAYGTNVAVAGLGLLNVLITARALGVAGRGEVAFLMTMGFLTSQLAVLGIHQAAINFAAKEDGRAPAVLGTSLVLGPLLGLAGSGVVVGLLALVPAADGGASTTMIALVLAAVPVLVLGEVAEQIALGRSAFRAANVAWVLVPVLTFLVNGTLALAGELTAPIAVGAWIGGQVLSVGVLLAALGRPAKPELRLAREMVAFGVRSHPGRVMLVGNYRADQWILGAVAGQRELGIYSIAVAWAEALFFLPTALARVQRADLVRAGGRVAAEQAARALRAALILTTVLAAGLIVVAPLLCVGVFGDDFRPAVGDLRILALGAFGIVALKLLGNTLTAQGRPLLETAAIGTAFVVILVLDALLIPAHGATGAAVASTVAYLAGGIAVVALFVRALPARAGEVLPRAADARELVTGLRAIVRR